MGAIIGLVDLEGFDLRETCEDVSPVLQEDSPCYVKTRYVVERQSWDIIKSMSVLGALRGADDMVYTNSRASTLDGVRSSSPF